MQTISETANLPAVAQVTEGDQIAAAVRQVKHGGRGFVTNFFAGPKQIESWVNRGELSFLQDERWVWIRRRDRGFFHLYYFAADADAIEESLASVDAIAEGAVLAIDLVGQDAIVAPVARVFRKHGFADQAVLVRMARSMDSNPMCHGDSPDVEIALPDDAPAILSLLETTFDPYSKQIPDQDQILQAVSAGRILIVRRDAAIAGLVFFEAAGAMATLRYWCVDEAWRDQGIGAKLIKVFFNRCRTCRSIVLWVCTENESAIRRYEHYGFRRTDTKDLILVRR